MSMFNKRMKYSFCLVFSSLVGLLLSSYAAYVENKTEENEEYQALCDISEKISCSKVFSSSYGKGFGVVGQIFGENSLFNQPNGYLGVGFYGFLIVTGFSFNKAIAKIQLISCAIAVILSIYLAYLLYYILEDFCVICVSTYIINLLNLMMTWRKLKLIKQRTNEDFSNLIKKLN